MPCQERARELEWILRESRALGVPIDVAAAELLARFTDLLQQAASRTNLTAIRERADIWLKHHLDSLSAALVVPEEAEGLAVDVGSGAGFPGIPLAVARPKLRLALVESVQRKAAFLRRAVQELHLPQVQVVAERAEKLAHRPGWRAAADWTFIRAVGSLAESVELCGPLVKRGGLVVVMKGPGVQAEWEQGLAHAGRGGLELAERRDLLLAGQLRRVLVIFRRVGEPPEDWPRRPGRLGRG